MKNGSTVLEGGFLRGVPLIYSGEKTTGYASGANGGSIPIVFPQLSNREKSKAPEQEKRNSTKCGLFGGLCRLTPQ